MSGTSHFWSRSQREKVLGLGPDPVQKQILVQVPGPLCPSLVKNKRTSAKKNKKIFSSSFAILPQKQEKERKKIVRGIQHDSLIFAPFLQFAVFLQDFRN